LTSRAQHRQTQNTERRDTKDCLRTKLGSLVGMNWVQAVPRLEGCQAL
jgi:hypothetical protein